MEKSKIKDNVKQLISLGIVPEQILSVTSKDALIISLDQYFEKYFENKKQKKSFYENSFSTNDEFIFSIIEMVDRLGDDFELNSINIRFLFEIRNEFIGQSFDYIKNLLIIMVWKFFVSLRDSENKRIWIGYESQMIRYIKARKFLSWRALNVILIHIFVKNDNAKDPLSYLITSSNAFSNMAEIKERWFDWIDYDIFRFDGNTHYSDMNANLKVEKLNLFSEITKVSNEKAKDIINSASFFIVSGIIVDSVWEAIQTNPKLFKKDFS